MINERTKQVFIILGVLLGLGIIVLLVIVYVQSGSNGGNANYPESVQSVINNPLETNDGWNTLETNDKFEISYSSINGANTFFITINAQPVRSVASEAEQQFLSKLGISKETACSMPVIIKVPASVDANLAGYDFSLSFCSNRVHISDF